MKGYLQTQAYKDGSPVKTGQTLFTIEATDYAAAVGVAKANLSRGATALARNKVQLERTPKRRCRVRRPRCSRRI